MARKAHTEATLIITTLDSLFLMAGMNVIIKVAKPSEIRIILGSNLL